MKKIIYILILLIFMISLGYGSDRQFYFVAKKERLGSLSKIGKSQEGIYLRWDLVEGDMPSEISEIILKRVQNGREDILLDVDANAIMSASEISKLFQNPTSSRRLVEAINFISSSDDPTCSGANLSNISQKIVTCLSDKYWSFLASRVNFDIARARYRAYLDTDYDKNAGKIEYILSAKDSSGTKEITLGKASVDLSKNTSILTAVDFNQTIESHCNDNRYGLDDYKVGLYWKNGGTNPTERFANNILISGYDLYYSTVEAKNFSNPENIDIAQLSANLSFDSNGNIDLSAYHLKKANDTLITLGVQDANKSKPIYVESRKELESRGFKPGEERYYFLVPRDFTGNYGKTVVTKVIIPNLLPPIAPINPRVVEKNSKVLLVWNSVNLKNYMKFHKFDLKPCTTKTINPKGRIRFVRKNEVCQNGKGFEANFNVDKYYIYRFDSAYIASKFVDNDLDGYNDLDEPKDTLCDSSKPTVGKNYLVATLPATSSDIVKFEDTSVTTSQVYWYRIVSVTKSKVASHMTPPIRAFIPKREILNAPDVNITHNVYKVFLDRDRKYNNQVIGVDETPEDAIKLRLTMEGKVYILSKEGSLFYLTNQIKERIFKNKNFRFHAEFLGKNSKVLADGYFKASSIFYFEEIKEIYYQPKLEAKEEKIIGYKIVSTFNELFLRKIKEEITKVTPVDDGCIDLNFSDEYVDSYKDKGCIQTTINIGNRRYKLYTDCNITKHKKLCLPSKNGDIISVGISYKGYDGINSFSKIVNIIPMSVPAPNKPSLIDLILDKNSNSAKISIRPKVQKITSTFLLLYNKDKNITFSKTVPQINENNLSKEINTVIEGLNLIQGDSWCVKAKAIGLDGQVSEWTTPICKEVLKEGEQPLDYIKWPKLQSVKKLVSNLYTYFDTQAQRVIINLKKVNIDSIKDSKPFVKKQDYSRIVAKDFTQISKTLEIDFYVKNKKVYHLSLTKNSDDTYKLPRKLDMTTDKLKEVNYAILTFYDASGQQLFKNLNKIEFNKERLLNIIENQYLISMIVEIRDGCSILNDINEISNFVVYRQTILSNGATNFVQVSPLIEKSTCENGKLKLSSNNLRIYKSQTTTSTTIINTRILQFVDNYPYIVGEKYRYVLVFFDPVSGEPVNYELTSPEIIEVK